VWRGVKLSSESPLHLTATETRPQASVADATSRLPFDSPPNRRSKKKMYMHLHIVLALLRWSIFRLRLWEVAESGGALHLCVRRHSFERQSGIEIVCSHCERR